jgi:hypothetical protein
LEDVIKMCLESFPLDNRDKSIPIDELFGKLTAKFRLILAILKLPADEFSHSIISNSRDDDTDDDDDGDGGKVDENGYGKDDAHMQQSVVNLLGF